MTVAWEPWMSPTVSIEEARASAARRRERDEQEAAKAEYLGIVDADRFLARVRQFDRNTGRLELLAIEHDEAGAADTYTGMLARVNDLIAELVEPLFFGPPGVSP